MSLALKAGLMLALMLARPAFCDCPALTQGIQEYNAGNYTEAISKFGTALAQDYNNAVLHYYLASCYAHIKLKDDAVREFRIAYALQPDAEVGKFAKQALVYLGAETDGAPKKPPVELKPPPLPPSAEDKAAAMLRMQAEQLKASRSGLSQNMANDMARRSEDSLRRTTNDMLGGLPYNRHGNPNHLPPDAQRQLEILKSMFDTNRNNALQSGAKESQEIQKSAENLQNLLNDKAPTHSPHLDPYGTNLYIRKYKPDASSAPTTAPQVAPAPLQSESPMHDDGKKMSIWGKVIDLDPDAKPASIQQKKP